MATYATTMFMHYNINEPNIVLFLLKKYAITVITINHAHRKQASYFQTVVNCDVVP